MRKPIYIQNVSLFYPNKLCFEGFSANITYGCCIGLIGDNGCGKSTLLKMLSNTLEPSSGAIGMPDDVVVGYVPQLIAEHHELSGGQRFNKCLSQVLAIMPNLLLLDEPTNHLDKNNRQSLLRMLENRSGTSVLATHDVALLHACADVIWHIDNQHITIFNGRYDDYLLELQNKKQMLERQKTSLQKEKKQNSTKFIKEQKRAANSKRGGKKKIANRKWPTVVSSTKAANAVKTGGLNQARLAACHNKIEGEMNKLYQPEKITAKFTIKSSTSTSNCLITINNGALTSKKSPFSLRDLNFTVCAGDRLAIKGKNGTGKTTLLKALMHDDSVRREGQWLLPQKDEIGYLDQHYQTLTPGETVFNSIRNRVVSWSDAEIRQYLCQYLFRKNEEVAALTENLSCGENARLSLAELAIDNPNILLLDEITNNVDIRTRQHIIDVLNQYEGTVVVISHDENFLDEIHVVREYCL